MVAEQRLIDMEQKINAMEEKMKSLEKQNEDLAEHMDEETAKRNKLDQEVKKLIEIKDIFGKDLQGTLTQMKVETEQKHGMFLNDLQSVIEGAKQKFSEVENHIKALHEAADIKFKEMDANIKNEGGGAGGSREKKNGFLPDKMMVPKNFTDDIATWRKWKEEVAKYFDDGKEGMKMVMDDVAKLKIPVTKEILEQACQDRPQLVEQVLRWKHVYRALEKLTGGEAAKVISTVPEENGFEAWRQLHLRFEPELEAQKNVVLLELHSIPPATSIEETKVKLVELRCRIAKAEDILSEPIQEMQKKTALLQVIDPITKQHTATLKEENFAKFYTVCMNFANNASMGVPQARTVNALEKMQKEEHDDGDHSHYEGHGYLNGMSRSDQCNNCGKFGHWARECPNKGKGKGKGDSNMSGEKGKGKGKGPATGCWQCGGDHYASQCPHSQKGGKSSSPKGSGKGFWGGKSKGNGRLNFMNEYSGWDQWEQPQAEAFCCSLKTVEPRQTKKMAWEEGRAKAVRTREHTGKSFLHNQFAALEDDEEHEEITERSEEKPVMMEMRKTKEPMPRVKRWRKLKITEMLAPIKTIEPEQINNITADGKWEEIELAVDSGATESVGPAELVAHVPTLPSPASQRGVMYEVASGHQIPNEGEKKFEAITEEGVPKKMCIQIADVNQGLLSVSKATKAGNRVVFDVDGSFIENKSTGSKTWLQERNGMYILKLWVGTKVNPF